MALPTYITVTNRTSTVLSLVGDEGVPRLDIGHTTGANSENINLNQVEGNTLLCDTLSSWITSAKVAVTRGSVTLTAAQMTAWKVGGDMPKDDYDADDDGIIDALETPAYQQLSTTQAVDLISAASDTSSALGGVVTDDFIPTRILVDTTAVAGGVPNGDAAITIGTAAGGTQILPATTLTGLTAVGTKHVIAITGDLPLIAANATLHIRVTTADTGAGLTTCTANVIIQGTYV